MNKRVTADDLQANREHDLDLIYDAANMSRDRYPVRAAFYTVALKRGWTTEHFDTWAGGKEWWAL